MKDDCSLVVVGLGIKFFSHLTTEAKCYIKNSNVVFYLANEPAVQQWIKQYNPSSESLDTFYGFSPLRLYCYKAMTEHVLDALRKSQHVCLVLYGHPTVFAKPALDAVRQAKIAGYDAKIIPGISAEDCMFADLAINPGSCGCLSYEATDFLIHRRCVAVDSHLVLWQIGIIGALTYPREHDNTQGIKVLMNYLAKYYSLTHSVILYEAAQYPHFEPYIKKMSLQELPSAKLSPLTTLYVPPGRESSYDQSMLKALCINIQDLKI